MRVSFTPEEVQATIESLRFPPDDVLRSAVEHADHLAPTVIALAERAAAGTYLTLPEERLLFAGIHSLAAARCTALYRPLMRLARLLSLRAHCCHYLALALAPDSAQD